MEVLKNKYRFENTINRDNENFEKFEKELKIKYETGDYILLTPSVDWVIVEEPRWDCDNYVLIHNKHKDILEGYLKNPSVEIETGMFASMTGETEPSKWVKLEKDFIEDYNEEFWYRLKEKDLNLTISVESDRLKDLFLNNKAECLVENEQEFRLIYDFLDKSCDKSLNRYLNPDGSFNYATYNDIFPICITGSKIWGNIYEWHELKNRKLNKPLIKYSDGVFSLAK